MRLIVLALCFFASVVHAGQWSYQQETDKMSGKTARYAQLESENSLSLDFPYQGRNKGTLTVRHHPKYGLDVYVGVEKGQMLCRVYDGCTVVVRFDDSKPQRFSAVPPADHSSDSMFIENASRFITAAKKSKRILVQVQFFQNGDQVLEFTSAAPLAWK
jgi:hypothetical protein